MSRVKRWCLRLRNTVRPSDAASRYRWAILQAVCYCDYNFPKGRKRDHNDILDVAQAYLLGIRGFFDPGDWRAEVETQRTRKDDDELIKAMGSLKDDILIADMDNEYGFELTPMGHQYVMYEFERMGPKGKREEARERFQRRLLIASLILNVLLAIIR